MFSKNPVERLFQETPVLHADPVGVLQENETYFLREQSHITQYSMVSFKQNKSLTLPKRDQAVNR